MKQPELSRISPLWILEIVIPCRAPHLLQPNILSEMAPLVCGETLQLVNSKVQHVHSANDLQTILIVIVSSSEPPFLFLICFKSTFRNPVHLVWVVLPINIKHNHILRQSFTGLKNPDRAKLYDSCLSRKERHLCQSSHIMRSLWGIHKNRSKL